MKVASLFYHNRERHFQPRLTSHAKVLTPDMESHVELEINSIMICGSNIKKVV